MSEIEWADPPPKRTHGKYEETAQSLRANPHRWARIGKGASSSFVTNFRGGRTAAFRPAEDWEFRAVTVDDGVELYARFVGGESA